MQAGPHRRPRGVAARREAVRSRQRTVRAGGVSADGPESGRSRVGGIQALLGAVEGEAVFASRRSSRDSHASIRGRAEWRSGRASPCSASTVRACRLADPRAAGRQGDAGFWRIPCRQIRTRDAGVCECAEAMGDVSSSIVWTVVRGADLTRHIGDQPACGSRRGGGRPAFPCPAGDLRDGATGLRPAARALTAAPRRQADLDRLCCAFRARECAPGGWRCSLDCGWQIAGCGALTGGRRTADWVPREPRRGSAPRSPPGRLRASRASYRGLRTAGVHHWLRALDAARAAIAGTRWIRVGEPSSAGPEPQHRPIRGTPASADLDGADVGGVVQSGPVVGLGATESERDPGLLRPCGSPPRRRRVTSSVPAAVRDVSRGTPSERRGCVLGVGDGEAQEVIRAAEESSLGKRPDTARVPGPDADPRRVQTPLGFAWPWFGCAWVRMPLVRMPLVRGAPGFGCPRVRLFAVRLCRLGVPSVGCRSGGELARSGGRRVGWRGPAGDRSINA